MTVTTIGTDIEGFLSYKGKVIPAYEHPLLCNANKDNPIQVEDIVIHPDNVTVELAVPYCEYDYMLFYEAVQRAIRITEGFLESTILYQPSLKFHKSILMRNDRSVEMGCEPSYNASSLKQGTPSAYDGTTRFAGGHIHLGLETGYSTDAVAHLVKLLDMTLGVQSVLKSMDGDKERRVYYGRAGEFRPKPYGLEYRTPSNFWVRNANYRWMFTAIDKAVAMYNSHYEIGAEDYKEVVDAINTCNRTKVLKELV